MISERKVFKHKKEGTTMLISAHADLSRVEEGNSDESGSP